MTTESRQLKVKDIFTNQLLSCDISTSLFSAVTKMRAHKVSSIFVTEEDKIVGIWTESDCVKLNFSQQGFQQTPIGELMATPVQSVQIDKSLSEATIKFHQLGIRHLLVKDEHFEPVGVVSLSDIVRNQGLDHYLHFRPIEDHYEKKVTILDSNDCISKVIDVMRIKQVTAVLIHNMFLGEYGIITQRDIAYMVLNPDWRMPCWELASYPMQSVVPKDSLFDAYRLMTANSIRHLVVKEPTTEQVIGLLALKNVLTEIETAYCSELEKVLAQRDLALQKS